VRRSTKGAGRGYGVQNTRAFIERIVVLPAGGRRKRKRRKKKRDRKARLLASGRYFFGTYADGGSEEDGAQLAA